MKERKDKPARPWADGPSRGQRAAILDTLSRPGLSLYLLLRSGRRIYCDLSRAARQGVVHVRPWGVDHEMEIQVSEIAVASAAEVGSWAELRSIRQKQRGEFAKQEGER